MQAPAAIVEHSALMLLSAGDVIHIQKSQCTAGTALYVLE